MVTIIDRLAKFATATTSASLPVEVADESRRILLDSLGCALASLDDENAARGVNYASMMGGANGNASILGTSELTSVPAATFANAELINALDQDAVLPPGHVTPYVLPGALATAEATGAPGTHLLTAIAVAHEMSFRIGKATDYLRDSKDGVITIPDVIGYSSTSFGGTAAVGVIKGLEFETMADALGIMGSSVPANTQRAWIMHAPATTIKYQLAGALAMATVTAANLAELGHTGDREILDDREYGFPRFIGTTRWNPGPITKELGETWTFPPFQSFKPYPHCRVMHAIFDELIAIVDSNDLRPCDIDEITAWGESFVQQPTWVNENVRNPRDAQFSMTHGMALAAHNIAPGKEWQDPETVLDPSVMSLMERSHFEPHPDHASMLASDPAARKSKVRVVANGRVFEGERNYPKGSPSADPGSYMTDEQLIAKFRHNVSDVISDRQAEQVVEQVFELESIDNISTLTALLRPAS